MIVHYRKIWGIFLLVIAVSDLGLGIASGLPTTLFVGVIVLVLGLGYLTRPYATVEQDAVYIHAVFGPLKRTFPYQQLRIENNKLYADSNGELKKVPVSKWLADQNDWNAIVQQTYRP